MVEGTAQEQSFLESRNRLGEILKCTAAGIVG
jgi:hypothetical protein